MSRAEAVSLLFGHNLSVQFEVDAGIENQWFLGSSVPVDIDETRPWELRLKHPLVSELLLLAIDIGDDADQPFMPFEECSLQEAIKYLASKGSVGVRGGIIYWSQINNQFTCISMSGEQRQAPVIINAAEVSELLKANYKVVSSQISGIRAIKRLFKGKV